MNISPEMCHIDHDRGCPSSKLAICGYIHYKTISVSVIFILFSIFQIIMFVLAIFVQGYLSRWYIYICPGGICPIVSTCPSG